MTKQHATQTSYIIDNYIITIKRIKNDINGNPRFEAIITSLKLLSDNQMALSYNYTFTGHYDSEKGEAQNILNYHLKNR